MDNLHFNFHQKYPLNSVLETMNELEIKKLSYQPSSNTIIILTTSNILIFITYNFKTSNFAQKSKCGPIDELVDKNVILMSYLVESESVLIATREGGVMTIQQKNGDVELKAEDAQGLVGATISPMQDYLYIATKNRTLIQLNMEFDPIKQIPIDDSDENFGTSSQEEVRFTWRADGKYFVCNYPTPQGRKCLTRDIMMGVTKSPSASDPDPNGPVQSVSEKGLKNIDKFVCWQPMGGIISGLDETVIQEKTIKRVIFWEKNGLRHLEFCLPENISSVREIDWVYCRNNQPQQLFIVEADLKDTNRSLLFYYRANYHWYLKSVVGLGLKDSYLIIQGNRETRLIIFRQKAIQSMELKLRPSEQALKTLEQQDINPERLFYNVDGKKLHLTDFSQGLIPPPMSQFTLSFDSFIRGVVRMKLEPFILIIFQSQACIYNFQAKKEQRRIKLQFSTDNNLSNIIFSNLQLIKVNPLQIKIGKYVYGQVKLDKIIIQDQGHHPELYRDSQNVIDFSTSIDEQQTKVQQYILLNNDNQSTKYSASLENNTLTLSNQQINIQLTRQATSYTFYHQFFLYTTKSNGMYEKLYIFNLSLDTWLFDDSKDLNEEIQQLQSKGKLNFRFIERGGVILTCSKGRLIMQLPRGNLESFYPKIITISSVYKAICKNKYLVAFQLVRTHKLDLNLIVDINWTKFLQNTQAIMKQIQKVDYINLLVSQVKEQLCSQLQYCYLPQKMQLIETQYEVNLKGHKIKKVCQQVSKVLRKIDQNKYILSIFTSQIKSNNLENVLFQIKEMRLKQNEMNIDISNIPPHLNNNAPKKPKIRTAQQILQYVCWLVDPEPMYQASLLTYDLELASMTARCTQKDPKEYIPYLESLKEITNRIDLITKICMDLKKYDKAIIQLSKGNENNINQALELIKKHKMFKCGVLAFTETKNIKKLQEVKMIIIQHLIEKGEFNEAYNICFSIKKFNMALDIGIQQLDGKKIQEAYSLAQDPPSISQIIDKVKDGIKNKGDLAKLYAMNGEFQEAARLYLRAGQYKNCFKIMHRLRDQFINSQIVDGFRLCFSLIRNRLIKERTDFMEKFTRLTVVQKSKMKMGNIVTGKNRDNQDMYSQISASSRSGSQYTFSTTTGMRRKKDKKKNILTRNVKEGSPLEEEYLLAFLAQLQTKVEQNLKQTKILIQHLIYLSLIQQSTILRNQARQYLQVFKKRSVKSAAKLKFQQTYPQAAELYYQEDKKNTFNIDSFDYML